MALAVAVPDSSEATSFNEVRKLIAADAQEFQTFGQGVAISGDTAIVGASVDDSGGAAYVFQRDNGGADNWGEVTKLTASDARAGDFH